MVKEKRIDSFFKRKRTDFEAHGHESETACETPTTAEPEPAPEAVSQPEPATETVSQPEPEPEPATEETPIQPTPLLLEFGQQSHEE